MRKLPALFFLLAVGLWAADFWQSKSFTEWNDKDVAKMLTDSPWAHRVTISVGSLAPSGSGPGAGRKGGDGGGMDDAIPNIGSANRNAVGDATSGGFGGVGDGGGRAGRASDESMGGIPAQGITLVVRWYTAC